jgi:hypothetical protein
MGLKLLGAIVGIALFAAYFLPIAFKLKEASLILIVAGGIVIAIVDAWHTFNDRGD